MNKITIKQHEKIRECPDLTNYDLEILMDGKPTNICIEASSGSGSVEGWICFLPRGYEGMEEMVKTRTKTIYVDGNITNFKKHILENIDEILEFIFEDVIVLQTKIDETYKILRAHLMKRDELLRENENE